MRAIILLAFLIPLFTFGQETNGSNSNTAKENQEEFLKIKHELEKLTLKYEKIEEENDEIVGVANTIISWSGRIFAIFAILLSFAAVYSGYQMSQIRKIKNDLEDLYEKSKAEIEEQKKALELLRMDFEYEKEVSLKLLFPIIEGQWHFYHGNYPDALSAFKEAQKIKPDNPKIIRNLYKILANSGELEEAIRNLEEMMKKFPEEKMIKYRLAQAYRRNKQLENAKAIIRDTAIIEKFPPALYEYGIINMYYKKYEEAEGNFIEANRQFISEEGASKFWVFIALSVVQLLRDEIEDSRRNGENAMRIINSSIGKTPNNPELIGNLGLAIIMSSEDYSQGKQKIKEALKAVLPVELSKSMKFKLELIQSKKEHEELKNIILMIEKYIKEN